MGMLMGNKQMMNAVGGVGAPPVFEGYTTWTYQSGYPSVINLPYVSGIELNDILIITLICDNISTNYIPSGWSQYYNMSTTGYGHRAMWKRADGTEAGILEIDMINNTYGMAGATMLRISGCIESGSPFDDAAHRAIQPIGLGSSLSLTLPATPEANRLAICTAFGYDDIPINTYNDGAYTPEYMVIDTLGTDSANFIWSQQILEAGATGGAVGYTAYTSDYRGAVLFSLRPIDSLVSD